MFFRSRSDSARWICQSEWVLTSGGDDATAAIHGFHRFLITIQKNGRICQISCQFGQELTDSPHLPTNYSQTIPKSVDFSHFSHVFLRCFHENRGNGPATWPRIVERRSSAVKHWTGHGGLTFFGNGIDREKWVLVDFVEFQYDGYLNMMDFQRFSYPKWSTDDYGRTL